MTTMLEKMARAIHPDAWNEVTNKTWAEGQKFKARNKARAALQAIREVPESISSVAKYDEYDWAGRNFTAMIDAILSEQPEP